MKKHIIKIIQAAIITNTLFAVGFANTETTTDISTIEMQCIEKIASQDYRGNDFQKMNFILMISDFTDMSEDCMAEGKPTATCIQQLTKPPSTEYTAKQAKLFKISKEALKDWYLHAYQKSKEVITCTGNHIANEKNKPGTATQPIKTK